MDMYKNIAKKAGYNVAESIERGKYRWISPNLSASHKLYDSEAEAWRQCCIENKIEGI